MGTPHQNSHIFWVVVHHVSVPFDPLLHLVVILLETKIAQGKGIVGRTSVPTLFDSFPVVPVGKPFIVAQRNFNLPHPVELFDFLIGNILDEVSEYFSSFGIISILEEDDGLCQFGSLEDM